MKTKELPIRILILEDKQYFASCLTSSIQKVLPDAEMTVRSSADIDLESVPDLAILDIGLEGTIDGIEFMKRFGNHIPAILFYSVCQHRMKECFGDHVLGFIGKDEDEKVLLFKLQQAKTVIENYPRIWLLNELKRKVPVRIDQICSVCKEDRIYWIYDQHGQKFRTSNGKLDQDSIWEDERFIRINQGELVNKQQIISVQGNEIQLANGQNLYISRRRLKEVEQQLW